ncbi:MAG: hypothetical protein HY074_09280 [Deltaproteobacteria bacterium]|nr:hypothetical protein [Deltaproteobacteria bacterium]
MAHFVRVALLILVIVTGHEARASGEITYLPSYYLKVGKFDLTRLGLYVQEDLAAKWYYSSWTGAGKVFLNDGSIPQINWYTTQQDLTRVLNDRFKVGGGAGFTYTTPSSNKDFDLHVKLAVKLW